MIFKSTKDVVQVNDVFLLKIIGGSGLRDCQLHFTSPTSSVKANETAVFHFVQNVFPKASGLSVHFIRRLPQLNQTGLSAHFIRRLPRLKQTGLPMLRIVFLGGTLPKAFQTNTSCSFGFFNAHPLNQASLFRVFALKKPITL